jgi:hypothetical protein
MGIKVRAFGGFAGERKSVGYYDLKRRYPGDEFEIQSESEFSPKWMERLDGPPVGPAVTQLGSGDETEKTEEKTRKVSRGKRG